MTSLSDFLGTLASEFTRARVMADLQTKAFAEQYAEDEILAHFPIPKFRFPEVDLEIPIGIEKLETPAPVPNNPSLEKSKLLAVYYDVVRDYLADHEVKTTRAYYELFRKVISPVLDEFENALARGSVRGEVLKLFSNQVAELASQQATDRAREVLKKGLSAVAQKIEQATAPFLPKLQEAEPAKVLVTTNATALANLSPSTIMRVKVKLRESGMEWSFGEDVGEDGSIQTTRQISPE